MADLKSNTASAGSVRPPLDIPVARHRTLATRSAIIPNHNAAAVAAPPPQSLGSTSTVSHRDPRPRSHHHTPPRPRATTSPIGPPPRTGHGAVGRDLWLLRGLWWLHVRVLLPALRPLHDRRDDRPRRNGRKEYGAANEFANCQSCCFNSCTFSLIGALIGLVACPDKTCCFYGAALRRPPRSTQTGPTHHTAPPARYQHHEGRGGQAQQGLGIARAVLRMLPGVVPRLLHHVPHVPRAQDGEQQSQRRARGDRDGALNERPCLPSA